ncbi:MAG: hypothetical protein JXR44_04055 [Thiotrichales bacterium]|nr:hypothetical protein [Thiotrichales bacterium]
MSTKPLISTFFILGVLTANSALAAEQPLLNRDSPLAEKKTLDLCVEYASLDSDEARQTYLKELDLRSQLSVKDHELVPQKKVENSMTACGMYMSKGKPMAEQSRQIRPMTFKTVHVYEDMYFVTQSGMVVGSYVREEGVMPPALSVEIPKVEPSPTLKP